MTDANTQQKRDLELEFYREKLTELANYGAVVFSDIPVALWADRVLATGETLTGPGVDMTDEERAAAVKLLEG